MGQANLSTFRRSSQRFDTGDIGRGTDRRGTPNARPTGIPETTDRFQDKE